jgi:hypothetical protein
MTQAIDRMSNTTEAGRRENETSRSVIYGPAAENDARGGATIERTRCLDSLIRRCRRHEMLAQDFYEVESTTYRVDQKRVSSRSLQCTVVLVELPPGSLFCCMSTFS